MAKKAKPAPAKKQGKIIGPAIKKAGEITLRHNPSMTWIHEDN